MWVIDDWHDGLRLLTILLSVFCLYVLIYRHHFNSSLWNAKTRDYWYILIAWSIAAASLAVEGISEDRPIEPRVLVYFVATLITFRGLVRDGVKGHADPNLFPHNR